MRKPCVQPRSALTRKASGHGNITKNSVRSRTRHEINRCRILTSTSRRISRSDGWITGARRMRLAERPMGIVKIMVVRIVMFRWIIGKTDVLSAF